MENATIVPDDGIGIGAAESKPSVAFVGRYKIWLAGGTTCPQCGRRLHASDVEVDFGDVRLICGACHRNVLTIGSAS